MSSSFSGLTRSRSTRSTRQPRAEAERDDETQRNVSPSRLPVKGAPGSSASATDRSSSRAVPATTATKSSRPLSGAFGRPRQATVASQDSSTTGATTTRPPRTTRAPTLTRPPSSSAQTSSTSASRPTTSSGLPASGATSRQRAPSSHTRTKSSVTTLTSATILRPPSQGSAATASSTSTAATAQTQTDRSRPPITRAATAHHRRQLSGPTPSSSAALAARRPARDHPAQQQPPPQPATTTTSNLDAIPPRHRPAFTTLQQHYSPAKTLAPKPLTATFFAPPSPSKLPANVAISAETARLQTELLQLHLMHRDAGIVTTQWRASARQKLGARFSELVTQEHDATKMEAAAEEAGNVKALVAWGDAGRRLEEKIQILDTVLCGVWAMGEPGGRYARVVRRFEKWAAKAEEVVEMRGEAAGLEELVRRGGDVLVGELDTQWKDECTCLVRRLDEWRRGLRDLERVEEGEESSNGLVRILAGCGALVGDMLAELDVMEQIEREVVVDEMRWVREVNRRAERDAPKAGAGAIWRVL